MRFETKLEQIVSIAEQSAASDLRRQLNNLSRIVAVVLKSGEWARLPAKTQRHLNVIAAEARDAADLADAASYVVKRVLSASYGQVADLPLVKDLHATQRRITDLFEGRKVPNRGFVYVAWSGRPERFVYVGKAGSNGRLNLVAHGKLANATAYASRISLLFPSQSRPGTLGELEACVIRLVKFRTGKLPLLNKREELVPGGPAADQLEALTGFLDRVARSVNCYI